MFTEKVQHIADIIPRPPQNTTLIHALSREIKTVFSGTKMYAKKSFSQDG
jgi:hypothetical protein